MLPIPRLFDAYEAIVALNREGVSGDVVECGVWNGGCVGLMALANLRAPGSIRRKFHLFDSFEGLPQPSSYDVDVLAGFKSLHPELEVRDKSDAALQPIGACVGQSQPEVEKFLVEKLKLNRDDLVFHTGWFQDTVPRVAQTISAISLLRIDGDWYESTKVCLDDLYSKVAPGGYIIIDDYGIFSGCRKATDEFLETKAIRPDIRYSDSECIFFRKR
jgi:hypothetical protein